MGRQPAGEPGCGRGDERGRDGLRDERPHAAAGQGDHDGDHLGERGGGRALDGEPAERHPAPQQRGRHGGDDDEGHRGEQDAQDGAGGGRVQDVHHQRHAREQQPADDDGCHEREPEPGAQHPLVRVVGLHEVRGQPEVRQQQDEGDDGGGHRDDAELLRRDHASQDGDRGQAREADEPLLRRQPRGSGRGRTAQPGRRLLGAPGRVALGGGRRDLSLVRRHRPARPCGTTVPWATAARATAACPATMAAKLSSAGGPERPCARTVCATCATAAAISAAFV